MTKWRPYPHPEGCGLATASCQDPEWLESERERNRGRYYKKMAKNKEEALRRYKDYEEKQRALGRVRRRCPDGKRKWLTREEFFKEYGYWPKK